MKKAEDFTTSIELDESPAKVFEAVTNVKAWWQGEIKGSSEKEGDVFTYQMNDVHYSKQEVVEFTPDQRLVWLVTDSRINFVKDTREWIDTRIVFDIARVGDKTKLTFTHEGLVPAFECYGGCSGAWGDLIQKSLFSLITTGKGVDVF